MSSFMRVRVAIVSVAIFPNVANPVSSLSSAVIAGGATLSEALANTGLAMYNYMTPLSGLTTDASLDR